MKYYYALNYTENNKTKVFIIEAYSVEEANYKFAKSFLPTLTEILNCESPKTNSDVTYPDVTYIKSICVDWDINLIVFTESDIIK